MSVIGKVSAVFTANSSGLVTGVNQAAASMRRMESNVSSLAGGMRTLVAIQGAQFFGGIVSAAGGYVRSLVSMGQAQAEVIDQQSKLAARLGMTYGEFAGLALAGDLAGVGMDKIANAATKADVAFVKAQRGSKTAQAGFANLGLSLADLSGMSAAERFEAISSAIAELPTEAQRSAAAVQMFGRAGAELLPLFAGGAEGIRQASEQAERLGLALTTAQGQDVEAMNDAFTMAGQAINGVVQQIVAYLAPAVKAVSDQFTNLVGSIGGANIGQAIGDGILQGARFLAGVGDYIIANFGSVFEYFSAVGEQWGAVADFMNRAANFMSGVFNAAQAGLGTVVLGFGAIVEGLARLLRASGRFVGIDTSGLDAYVQGAKSFNAEIMKGMDQNIADSKAGFKAAFAENATPVGAAIAGPLTTAFDNARAQAKTSAAQIQESGKGAAAEMATAVAEAIEPQAVKGIDSRSSEGVAEMFRLMRGGDTVQERIATATEKVAENTSRMNEPDSEMDF